MFRDGGGSFALLGLCVRVRKTWTILNMNSQAIIVTPRTVRATQWSNVKVAFGDGLFTVYTRLALFVGRVAILVLIAVVFIGTRDAFVSQPPSFGLPTGP